MLFNSSRLASFRGSAAPAWPTALAPSVASW